MLQRPHSLRVIILIGGSILFSLSVVNLFFPVFGLGRTFWQIGCVFVIAGLGIFIGRRGLKDPIVQMIVKSIIYAPLLAFLGMIILPFIPIQPVGRLVAHRDVSAGRYVAILPGSPWHKELTEMLQSRYGLESSVHSEGSFPIIARFTYYTGYQTVMAPAIKTKYGHDVVQECTKEVKQAWEKRIEEKHKTLTK